MRSNQNSTRINKGKQENHVLGHSDNDKTFCGNPSLRYICVQTQINKQICLRGATRPERRTWVQHCTNPHLPPQPYHTQTHVSNMRSVFVVQTLWSLGGGHTNGELWVEWARKHGLRTEKRRNHWFCGDRNVIQKELFVKTEKQKLKSILTVTRSRRAVGVSSTTINTHLQSRVQTFKFFKTTAALDSLLNRWLCWRLADIMTHNPLHHQMCLSGTSQKNVRTTKQARCSGLRRDGDPCRVAPWEIDLLCQEIHRHSSPL